MKRTSLRLADFIAEAKYELMPGVYHSEGGDDFTDGSEVEGAHILAGLALLLSDLTVAGQYER